MLQQESQAAYLSASANGATQIGLHVIVYNTLAGDLLRAGEACRTRDIATRCSASNRALLLLGHLETWTGHLDDGQLVNSLLTFYRGLRGDIIRLQVGGTAVDFDRLSESVAGVRAAWQAKEHANSRSEVTLQTGLEQSQVATSEPQVSRTTFAWCA